jgi:uncharacterized protein
MRVSLPLLPAFLALAIAAPALGADMRTGLTLNGTGEVLAAPDMATITTGVTTQAETAREALDANTEAMDELIAVLREAGLESRDIQTSDFTVTPQYVYSDQRDDTGYTQPPRISGYQVSNAVSIIVRDLESLGVILDQAVSVGANTINGIAFSVDDTDALYEEARRRAVADALAKADVYADAAGIELGAITAISEPEYIEPPRPMYAAARMEMAADSAVPVEAGEISYTVRTTISWEIGGTTMTAAE